MKTVYIVPERVFETATVKTHKNSIFKSKLFASALILGLVVSILQPATFGLADLTPAPDMSVTKTVDNTSPKEGENITYTITATNVGNELATNVIVNDLLPSDLTFVSASATKGAFDSSSGVWTVGDITAGDCGVLTITVKVNNGASQKTITNTASVTMQEPEPTPANNSASISVTVQNSDAPLACVSAKDAGEANENMEFSATGGNGEYNWTANTGSPDTGIGSSFATRYPTSGPKNIFVKSNGQTASCSVTISGFQGPELNCENTPSLCAQSYDPGLPSETISYKTDLSVTKTVNNHYPKEGETVEFMVTVANNGPAAAYSVLVEDLLPKGLAYASVVVSAGSYNSQTGNWSMRFLNEGDKAVMKLSAKVLGGTVGQIITNYAKVSMVQADSNVSNNSASASIKIVERCAPSECGNPLPDPEPNPTPDPVRPPREPNPSAPSAPAIICSASPSDITAGQTVTFTATAGFNNYQWFVNGGSVTSSNQQIFTSKFDQVGTYTATVTTSDTNPAISANCMVTVTSEAAPICASLTYSAVNSSVSKTSLKPSESFSAACDYGNGSVDSINASVNNTSCTFTGFIGTKANFNCLAPSTAGNYDVVCKLNTGTSSNVCAQTNKVATITVADQATPSEIICAASPSAIKAGETTTFSATPSAGNFTWTVTGGSVTATSSVSSFVSKFDQVGTFTATVTNSQGSQASCSVTVTASGGGGGQPAAPDVKVTKTVDKATASIGDTVEFTIVASNNGGSTANEVLVTDVLPAGLTFVASSTTVGTYDVSTGKWTIGNMAKDATATLKISAKINSGTAGTAITNTATIAMQQTDPTSADNTSSASVTVPSDTSGGGGGGGGSGGPAPQSTSSGGSGIPVPPGQILGSTTGLQMPFVGLQMPAQFTGEVKGAAIKSVLPRTGAPIALVVMLEILLGMLMVIAATSSQSKVPLRLNFSGAPNEKQSAEKAQPYWILRMKSAGVAQRV